MRGWATHHRSSPTQARVKITIKTSGAWQETDVSEAKDFVDKTGR